MAGGGGNDGGMISGINVTPLVNITLVLLIIFMVTAKILTAPALPLDLPKAVKSEEVQVIFSISVPVHGPLQINGKAVTGDQPFMKLAREALAKDPELRAVVQADGAVPHRQVVHVMDLLRRAGITHIAIGALPEEPEKT